MIVEIFYKYLGRGLSKLGEVFNIPLRGRLADSIIVAASFSSPSPFAIFCKLRLPPGNDGEFERSVVNRIFYNSADNKCILYSRRLLNTIGVERFQIH